MVKKQEKRTKDYSMLFAAASAVLVIGIALLSAGDMSEQKEPTPQFTITKKPTPSFSVNDFRQVPQYSVNDLLKAQITDESISAEQPVPTNEDVLAQPPTSNSLYTQEQEIVVIAPVEVEQKPKIATKKVEIIKQDSEQELKPAAAAQVAVVRQEEKQDEPEVIEVPELSEQEPAIIQEVVTPELENKQELPQEIIAANVVKEIPRQQQKPALHLGIKSNEQLANTGVHVPLLVILFSLIIFSLGLVYKKSEK